MYSNVNIKENNYKNALKVNCDKAGINQALQVIRDGGIVIFPTDTVYGIGCDPYNKKAVEKIYKIKSRDARKLMPVLVYSIDTAKKIGEFSQFAERIAKKFWPGPLTIILKVTDAKIKEALNLTDKIAIRVPEHKCVLELLKKCQLLVGTSANISGDLPHTDPNECLKKINNYDIFVDGGIITSKGESTIIEIKDEQIKIIRQGSLTRDEILQL